MKFENALELDLEGDLSPRMLFSLTVVGKLLLPFLALPFVAWWSLKVGDSMGRWIGPRPFPSAQKSYYENYVKTLGQAQGTPYFFTGQTPSFGGLDLSRLRELSKQDLQRMIIEDTPKVLVARLNEVLPLALHTAEYYQVDPFWVLAVMWTESHFNPKAVSRVKAQGLMQIMPATGHELVGRLARTQGLTPMQNLRGLNIHELPLQEPQLNIEMGTYYLSYLHRQFQGNFRLATVAYNMGPAGVRRRLHRQLPTGVRNQYLTKVQRAYQRLSRSYRQYLFDHQPPYMETYVVANRLAQKTAAMESSPWVAFPFDVEITSQVAWSR